MSSEACCQCWGGECGAEEIDGGEERFILLVVTGDKECVPEWVEAGTAGV